MLLKDLQIGESAVVAKIELPFQIERRLQALGMTLGTRIHVLNRKGKGIMGSCSGAPGLLWASI